eukprot:1500909-Rhodomonas_salina.1
MIIRIFRSVLLQMDWVSCCLSAALGRYEDWTQIQTNSTLCADNAALAAEEAQKAVTLSRK